MAAPTRVAAVVALAAVVHAGCSGPCKQVARAREAAAVRPEPAAGPHLRLRVPFATLNARIAEAVAARPPTPVRLSRWSLVPANPMPGLSAAVVGDLAVVVRSVRLGPAAPGYVHVEVEAELLVGAIAVAVVGGVDLQSAIERDSAEVAIALGLFAVPSSTLAGDLGDQLEPFRHALVAVLSSRPGAPREAIDAASYELSHAAFMTLMSSLRDVATVRVALPPVPTARIALTSTDGLDATLELGIVTSLPVRESVARTVAPAEEAFELAISGSAMAELANWAIATGHAPARFDRSLEPDLDGDYVPHFDWRTDHPRPLIVHVDRVHGGCEWFTVGVTPTLAIEGEQLVAGASARDFEQVLGPAYLHVAVWLKELLQRAVSRRVAAAATLTVAGRRVEAHLVGATLDDRGLRAAATLRIAPPGS